MAGSTFTEMWQACEREWARLDGESRQRRLGQTELQDKSAFWSTMRLVNLCAEDKALRERLAEIGRQRPPEAEPGGKS